MSTSRDCVVVVEEPGAREASVRASWCSARARLRLSTNFVRSGREVERRHLVGAEMALRELQWVSLNEALELVVLYAHEDPSKFEQASFRWLARYVLEGKDVRLMACSWRRPRSARFEGLG